MEKENDELITLIAEIKEKLKNPNKTESENYILLNALQIAIQENKRYIKQKAVFKNIFVNIDLLQTCFEHDPLYKVNYNNIREELNNDINFMIEYNMITEDKKMFLSIKEYLEQLDKALIQINTFSNIQKIKDEGIFKNVNSIVFNQSNESKSPNHIEMEIEKLHEFINKINTVRNKPHI